MIDPSHFKVKLKEFSVEEIVKDVILTGDAVHVSSADSEHIKNRIANTFSVDASEIELFIVGSAKLGFSLSENRSRKKYRYRRFGPDSDIDVAVVSPRVYRIIWDELCTYAHGFSRMPWDSERLGDYMVYGWLRPDCFPKNGNIKACDDWWRLFRKLSIDARFDRHKVRGGIYYSKEDLVRYHSRVVSECKNMEFVI